MPAGIIGSIAGAEPGGTTPVLVFGGIAGAAEPATLAGGCCVGNWEPGLTVVAGGTPGAVPLGAAGPVPLSVDSIPPEQPIPVHNNNPSQARREVNMTIIAPPQA